jgi:hypothetical protein
MRIWRRTLELLIACKQLDRGTFRESEFDRCQEEALRSGEGSLLFPQRWEESSRAMR